MHKWVDGIPGDTHTFIISLLGRKPNGESEFSFYPAFYGKLDGPQERRGKLSFQTWLDRRHKKRSFTVVEHPTYDSCPIATDMMAAISSEIRDLLSKGHTVVLMDSGGQQRTGDVCKQGCSTLAT